MSKGLFDNLEDDNGFDFEEVFKNAQKKEKPKKTKNKLEEKFGVPIEDLFKVPPSSLPKKEAEFDFISQQNIQQEPQEYQKSLFDFRKDIPKDVLDCLLNCLCTKCQKKIQDIKPTPIFEIDNSANSSFKAKTEEKIMKLFESDLKEDDEDDEYSFEDDIEDDDEDEDSDGFEDEDEEDDDFEDDDEDFEEEESTIKTREDIHKKLFKSMFEEKEEKKEKFEKNDDDFLGFKF